MKLIKLYSNKESFQSIEFNKVGLSLVIGCKDTKQQSNIKDTYNGVGKTLMLYIINFCLASNEIKAFKEKLPSWIFYLDFSINENKYTAHRNTSLQHEIYLNEEKLTLDDFKKRLAKELFYLEESIPNITFRSLMSKFMRRSRDEYANYAGVSDRAVNNWDTVLVLSYLLGLDYSKNLSKYNLKVKQKEADAAKKNIQNDSILKEYFNFNGNTEIELVDLEEKISSLTKELTDFNIAENFHEIQQQADNKAAEIQTITNQEFSLNHALKQIEKSLQIKTDISFLQVTNLYKNAGLQIPELIQKRLDDVQNFHIDLLKSRTNKLTNEKEKILLKQKEIEEKRLALSKEHDNLLRYLKGKGALEQRDALKQQLSDFQKKKEALSQGQKLFQQYEIKKSELKGLLDKENTETEKYLNYSEEGKEIKASNLKFFRKLANEFYNHEKNGFIIENNSGNAQVRFTLHPHIDYDSSDGINEVKIFCFDWMLLLGQHRHQNKCLIHDSRLFDAMDPRQASTALRIAIKMCEENNMQYIITLNESKYNEILHELEQYEFYSELELIKKSKVKPELTDKSEQTKLLGISVDMKYDS
jgi:uncharacterized protein YydD (DUF2326 family)